VVSRYVVDCLTHITHNDGLASLNISRGLLYGRDMAERRMSKEPHQLSGEETVTIVVVVVAKQKRMRGGVSGKCNA
jgi:hypothetical protein